MTLNDLLFGRPLRSSEEAGEKLGLVGGLSVFGLDALSSAAYGPEAGLTLLIPLAAAGIAYMVPITASISSCWRLARNLGARGAVCLSAYLISRDHGPVDPAVCRGRFPGVHTLCQCAVVHSCLR